MPITKNKIYYELDPDELLGEKVPRETKQEMADLILEEVLNYVGKSRSPVSGERWKVSLSPAYKKVKAQFSSNLKANMELTGGMLDSLECVVNRAGNLELRITGSAEVDKADGHNNFSGLSSLPQRRFIPDDGQTFKKEIISKLKSLASGEQTITEESDDDETGD